MKEIPKIFSHFRENLLPVFIIILLVFTGCKKDNTDDDPVSKIQILSGRQVSLTAYELIISSEIRPNITSMQLVFDDVTVLSAGDIVYNLTLEPNKQNTDTLQFNPDRLDHDFAITARLISGDDTIFSNQVVIRSQKNTFRVWIVPDDMFADVEKNIAVRLNSDQEFGLVIDYLNPFAENTVEVKLNKTITLENRISFKDYSIGSDYLSSQGQVYLNGEVEPGVYDVYLYIDGVEFKADSKIEVLSGKWSLVNSAYSWIDLYQYATFCHGKNLYLTGGTSPVGTPNDTKVWNYNFASDQWIQLKDFPVTNYEITHVNLQYDETWYIVAENNLNNESIELWKYNEANDSWSLVTTYPGPGKDLVCFILNGQFFAGGGRRRINEDVISYYDFRSFDLVNKTWRKCKDIPLKYPYPVSISCTSENLAFVYSFDNTLWTYQMADDKWTSKSIFPGMDRSMSNIVYLNNKVYLVGGIYFSNGLEGLKDCWEYDVTADKWKMISFVPSYSNSGFAGVYGNSIITGLGFSAHGYMDIQEPYLYLMTP